MYRVVKNRILLIIGIVSVSLSALAEQQDSMHFIQFTKKDLQANNVRSLQDVFYLIPFSNRYHNSSSNLYYLGGSALQHNAVYKDGFPLLMDQNVNHNLAAISVWDIDRIEVCITDQSSVGKNNSVMVIKLYSPSIGNSPRSLNVSSVTSNTMDNQTTASFQMSNRTHNMLLGAGRNYQQGLKTNNTREDAIASSLRKDLNVQYQFNILNSITLDLSSNHNFLEQRQLSNPVAFTTRVEDRNHKFNRHFSYGKLVTALSKRHRLSLSGMHHLTRDFSALIDRDLHTGESEVRHNTNTLDSLSYQQSFMDLQLSGDIFDHYGYSIGLDISNIKDLFFPSIHAIKNGYSDYSVYGLFEYHYQQSVEIQAGAKLLTNSLTSTYILPQASITLTPNHFIQVRSSFKSSIGYPLFERVFYPVSLTGNYEKNLLLSPFRQNSLNLGFDLTQGLYKIKSGLLFSQNTNLVTSGEQETWTNDRSQTSTIGYFGLEFRNSTSNIRPSFILHSNNPWKNSINQSFFFPELNTYFSHTFRKQQLYLSGSFRLIGEYASIPNDGSPIVIEEYARRFIANLSITREFFQNKFLLSGGIQDITNGNRVTQSNYLLQDFDRVLSEQKEVYSGVGRRAFIQLTMQL